MGSNNSSLLKVDSNDEMNSFPRTMQILTYDYSNDNQTRRKLDQLRSDHEKYLKKYSLKSNGKLNSYLVESMKKLEETRGFSSTMSFYFDNGNQNDLDEFAKNDPWVKAGLIRNWKCKFNVLVFDPFQMVRNKSKEKFALQI